MQVLAKTSTPAVTVQDNTSGDAVWAIGAPVPLGGGTVDVHATHGWSGSSYTAAQRTAAPFAILDAMYQAASAFLAARPTLPFPALKVNWSPNNTTDTNGTVEQGFLGTSYFDAQVNQIFVVGKDGVDTDEYDNHVIVHEWGHYFESNVSRSDSLGGDHTTGDVLDPRDAFSEGWGDAASGILTEDPIYVDTYWTGRNIDSFGWDLENEPSPTDDTSPGPFSEASVMRSIYDAWDSTNEASFDRLSLGLGPIADAFTTEHKTSNALATIGSFVTGLKASAAPSDVDALLAHSNIGPLTTSFGDGDAALRAMFRDVPSFPNTTMVQLNGREAFNFASQNRYWVVTGNGARITVSGSSAQDVGVAAYRKGVEVGFADNLTTGGTESFSFNSINGTIYVVTLSWLRREQHQLQRVGRHHEPMSPPMKTNLLVLSVVAFAACTTPTSVSSPVSFEGQAHRAGRRHRRAVAEVRARGGEVRGRREGRGDRHQRRRWARGRGPGHGGGQARLREGRHPRVRGGFHPGRGAVARWW